MSQQGTPRASQSPETNYKDFKMYCLDTSVIIELFRGHSQIVSKFDNLVAEFEPDFFITPITLCELYKGVYLYLNPEKEIQDVDNFISSFEVLNFNSEACKIFGKEYAKLKSIGKPIKEADLMIASIAKAHNLTFITCDKKHFEDLDLNVEVW